MSERETLDVDILIVGGGPAGLSAALQACAAAEGGRQDAQHCRARKSRRAGAHLLSGAVLDPRALAELIPDFEAKGAPLASKVHEDRIYFLTPTGKIKFPITPPPLRNHGNYIISLQQLGKWLSGLVEAEGIDMFSGFAGTELLMEGAGSSACERAIAASAAMARNARRSSRASTSAPRSRFSPTAFAAI